MVKTSIIGQNDYLVIRIFIVNFRINKTLHNGQGDLAPTLEGYA